MKTNPSFQLRIKPYDFRSVKDSLNLNHKKHTSSTPTLTFWADELPNKGIVIVIRDGASDVHFGGVRPTSSLRIFTSIHAPCLLTRSSPVWLLSIVSDVIAILHLVSNHSHAIR